MNTTFDISRFIKLFANEWQVNYKKILMFWCGLFGITAIFFALLAAMNNSADMPATAAFLYLVILIFHGLIISIHFGDFTSKNKTQALLLLPASQTETFTCKFVFSMIIFPAFALLYAIISLHIAVAYNQWAHEMFNVVIPQGTDIWELTYLNDWESTSYLICFWFFIASAFLCGSLTFKKLAFLKTFLFWFIFCLLLIPVTGCFYFIFSGHYPDISIPFLVIGENKGNIAYSLSDKYAYFIQWLGVFIGISLMIIARVRYNEKTI